MLPRIVVGLALFFAPATFAEEIPLFNGKDLDGWTLDAGSQTEPVPHTEVARPIFPTKPSHESKRSLKIPLIVAGLAVVFCVSIAGLVIVFSGVFAPDDEPATPRAEDESAAAVADIRAEETEVVVDVEPTPEAGPSMEINLSESIELMNEASAQFEDGNIDAALAIASQAIELAPEFAENYFERSEMYLSTEDFDLAMDDINRAIDLEPAAIYYFQRGMLHRSDGDQDRAIEDFHQAIEIDPSNPEPFVDLAIAYRQIEDFGASLEMSNMAVDIDPDNSRAFAVRARTLKELGDIESALEDGLRAHELDPENWRVADSLADIYAWYLGDPYEGIVFYSRAIDLRPDEAWRYGDRAILYREIDDNEAAMADLETAIMLDPEMAWYHIEEGITLRDGFGEIDAALNSFEQAMEIDPEDSEPYAERARTYSDYLGDYEAAIADVDSAIEIDPGEGWLFTLRAEIFQNMGDIAAAEADLIRATQLDSSDAWSFIDLGYFYFDVLGDVEPAFDAWNIAVEIEPENPHAYHARYLYYAHVLEDYDAAIADLSRCIDLDPYFPWCYWESAWLFDDSGDAESAVRDFEAYLELGDVDDCPECLGEATDYIEQH
jgi:tetratricopeptide (TPR) repeat protein